MLKVIGMGLVMFALYGGIVAGFVVGAFYLASWLLGDYSLQDFGADIGGFVRAFKEASDVEP